ncbi:MAG: zinc-binding dehydrogenase [Armatimonadota bacterium]
MQTTAVRLYGANDLRLETFDLPPIRDDEMLGHIISDSICMSSYKAAVQGEAHKRVPADIARHPIIMGHEFCGEILQVGAKWREHYHPGQRFAIQPALKDPNGPVGVYSAPGYSYPYFGGAATHIIIPNAVMERNCLLPYTGEGYFKGSLAEPMSCIVGAVHANYHTTPGTYTHHMDIQAGGACAILAGAGPMGLGAIDYLINRDRRPRLLVVTDIDQPRLDRTERLLPVEMAASRGVTLHYVNTRDIADPVNRLRALTDGAGYDDVFVYAPVAAIVEQADAILGFDGCLNFFAGPTDPAFSARLNWYNVHYTATHVVGTSGGNTDDMIESLDLMSAGRINPAGMVTHIGGLQADIPATLNLPSIPGGKKLIYTNIDLELTAIDDFPERGQSDPLFAELAAMTARHQGLWSEEAEAYLLSHARSIQE